MKLFKRHIHKWEKWRCCHPYKVKIIKKGESYNSMRWQEEYELKRTNCKRKCLICGEEEEERRDI